MKVGLTSVSGPIATYGAKIVVGRFQRIADIAI